MSIERWEEIISVVVKNIQSENLFKLQQSAFTSWTILVHAHGLKKSWKEFMKMHGIGMPEIKISDEEKAALIRQQIEQANNIIRFDTKRAERASS